MADNKSSSSGESTAVNNLNCRSVENFSASLLRLASDENGDAIASIESAPVQRKRGRPKKSFNDLFNHNIVTNGNIQVELNKGTPSTENNRDAVGTSDDTSLRSVKRKRGRPKRFVADEIGQQTVSPNTHISIKRKRGRPKKIYADDVKKTFSGNSSKFNSTSLIKRKRGRPSKPLKFTVQFKSRPRGRPSKSTIDQPKVLKALHNGDTMIIWLTQLRDQGVVSDYSNEDKSGIDLMLPLSEKDHPQLVISKFCKQMYTLGWATGTGGGMSVKHNDVIYMAPSGVQKEMIEPCDIFECDHSGTVLLKPEKNGLKLTECAPLFMNAYNLRNAGAVIHSHSMSAVLVSLLFKGEEFRISHIEMIKGIKKGSTGECFKYDDTLIVPIIENTLYERDLTGRMRQAINLYPDSNAVLVRRHGVYIWGDTWQRAKSQAECYHYLFEVAVKMKQMGLEPDEKPGNEGGIGS